MSKSAANPLHELPPKPGPTKQRSTASVFALLENVHDNTLGAKSMLMKIIMTCVLLAVMMFFLCVAGAMYVKDTTVDDTHHGASVQVDRSTGAPVATMGVTTGVDLELIMKGEANVSELTYITYSVRGGEISRTREVTGADLSDCETAECKKTECPEDAEDSCTPERVCDYKCLAVFTRDDAILFTPKSKGTVVPLADYTDDTLNPNARSVSQIADVPEVNEAERRKLLSDADPLYVASHIAELGGMGGWYTPVNDKCSNASWDENDVISFDFTKYAPCAAGTEDCTTLTRGQTCFFNVVNGRRCEWIQTDEFGSDYKSCMYYFARDYSAAKRLLDSCGADSQCQTGVQQALAVVQSSFGHCLTIEGDCTDTAEGDKCSSLTSEECGHSNCDSDFGANCHCEWGYERTIYSYGSGSGSGSASEPETSSEWYACSRIRNSRSRDRCLKYTPDSSRKASCKPVDSAAAAKGSFVDLSQG